MVSNKSLNVLTRIKLVMTSRFVNILQHKFNIFFNSSTGKLADGYRSEWVKSMYAGWECDSNVSSKRHNKYVYTRLN